MTLARVVAYVAGAWKYRIYSINRPGRFIKFLDLKSGVLIRGGRLFEAGRLLNFHHFQQV